MSADPATGRHGPGSPGRRAARPTRTANGYRGVSDLSELVRPRGTDRPGLDVSAHPVVRFAQTGAGHRPRSLAYPTGVFTPCGCD